MFTLYDGSNTQQKKPELEEHKISVANDTGPQVKGHTTITAQYMQRNHECTNNLHHHN
jgi:hypothetical protein